VSVWEIITSESYDNWFQVYKDLIREAEQIYAAYLEKRINEKEK